MLPQTYQHAFHLPFNPHQKGFGGTSNSKAIQIPTLSNSNKSNSDENNKPGPPRLSQSFGDYGVPVKRYVLIAERVPGFSHNLLNHLR